MTLGLLLYPKVVSFSSLQVEKQRGRNLFKKEEVDKAQKWT